MSTQTEQAREILGAEEIKKRSELILEALASDNNMVSTLLIKQVVNWPVQKRRQLFRLILKVLIQNTSAYKYNYINKTIKEKYPDINRWFSVDCSLPRSKMLFLFIDLIKTMTKEKDFVPEKTLTVSTLSLNQLGIEPSILQYLLDSGILVLSDKLSVKHGLFNIVSDVMHSSYSRNNQPLFLRANKIYNIHSDIANNVDRYAARLMANALSNLETVFEYVLNNPNVDQKTRLTLYNSIRSGVTRIVDTSNKPYHDMTYVNKDVYTRRLKEGNVLESNMAEKAHIKSALANQGFNLIDKLHKLILELRGHSGDNSDNSLSSKDSILFDPFIATI